MTKRKPTLNMLTGFNRRTKLTYGSLLRNKKLILIVVVSSFSYSREAFFTGDDCLCFLVLLNSCSLVLRSTGSGVPAGPGDLVLDKCAIN
jgi:hypothetical protein